MSAVQHALAFASLSRLCGLTLFLPGLPAQDPVLMTGMAEAAQRLRTLAGNRPLRLRTGRAAYPDVEDFPSITVRVDDGTPVGDKIATLGGVWPNAVALSNAADELARLAR